MNTGRFMATVGMVLMLGSLVGCNASGRVMQSTANWPAPTGFQTRTVMHDGAERKYTVFVPKGYQAGVKYPTIVFLHGVLEAGSDAQKNLGVGLGPIMADRVEGWPFIVLFPQSKGDWKGDSNERLVAAAMDQAVRELGADPDRFILTGLSNGGHGTWTIGARFKDRFAALVPMCGHSAYDSTPKLTGIPIWCFHNSMDPLVSAGGAREMVRRVTEAGGTVKYTQYSSLGHNCWDRAYGDGELMEWMLQQRRNGGAKTALAP